MLRLVCFLALLFAFGISHASAMNPPQMAEFGDYKVQIAEVLSFVPSETPDYKGPVEKGVDTVRITKGSEQVYYEEGFRYFLGDPNDPENPLLNMGNDITGDGEPDLVITHRSWGENGEGELTFKIFSIGPEFKLLKQMKAKDDGAARFKDLDGDGVLEFR